MAGTPGQFGVTVSDNVPPLYGKASTDFSGAIGAFGALLGVTPTAGKIFLGPSIYPTSVSGFSGAGKMQAQINQGSRIYLCYAPGGSTPASPFITQSSTERSSLVTSITSLASACSAAGTGAVIAGVIFYQEVNDSSHNIPPGSGGNDGGYIGCVNYYGNATTGVKSIAGAAGFLGGNPPRLGGCAGSGSFSVIASYFNPGAAQTVAYDFLMSDFYGSAYNGGSRLDAATNGPDTICRALGIPLAIGEMGSASSTSMPSNGTVTAYIAHVQSILTARLTANLNNAECMWFDGQYTTPVSQVVLSAAGTVTGSATATTLKTTTPWPAGPPAQPGNNYFIQARTEIMQVTGGSGTGTLTVKRGMQGTTAISTITGGDTVATLANGNNIITLNGDFRVPYLRSMVAAITTPATGSAAFTQVQDSISLNAAGGAYGLWFNQTGAVTGGSAAGNLLLARFVTDDGSQTITPPDSTWVKVSSATDASTGSGTSGQARAQIWACAGNPGGLGASQSYTATKASPCVFTVTGPAPVSSTPVVLSGSLPGGFSSNTVYYVNAPSGSTFQLAPAPNGTPVNSTSAVTSGGVIATTPVVFTYSNTSAHVRGHLTEYSVPAGNVVTADQASASTAHGTTATMAVSCAGANTLSGGMGAAIYGVAQTGGTTGQSISTPSGWSADGPANNLTLSYNTFTQLGLAAGTTSGTATYTPGTWAESGWAAAMVTFYATVPASLNITTTTLPNGTVSVAYSQTLTASGGVTPYAWTLNTGSQPLPAGLSLNGSTGVLSGTPAAGGAFAFTVLATDSAGGTDTQDYTLVITGGPQITTTSPLPAGTVGTAYSQTFTATGGTSPYTFTVSSGTLDGGLTLATSGALTGTPTGPAVWTFNVTVTDNAGATGTSTFTLTINAAPVPITPGGGNPAPPNLGYPQVIIEAGLYATAPVAAPGTLILDDPVNGLLDTGRLGDATAWTDLTTFLRSGTISRTSTRVQGPLRTWQAGTGSMTLDNTTGAFDPDNTAGAYYPHIRPMVPLQVRAVFGSTEYHLFSGFADTWAETAVSYDAGYSEVTASGSDGFKILAGITIPPLPTPAGAGELSGTRITRILNAASWYTDHRKIAAGDTPVQGTTFGDTALNLLQLTADTEIGHLYIDGTGAVVFRNRHATLTDPRSTIPQAVFGDLPGTAHGALTELACAAIGRADDDTTLANDIQIQRVGGTLQVADNDSSIATYLFPRTYARSDVLLQTDTEALSYAQWVLDLSLTGADRFDTLTIDPVADPVNLFPQVLGREIGDLITVVRRPQNSGTTITKNCYIRGITHSLDVTQGTWSTTWDLDDASKYTGWLILDDPVLGKLDSGNQLAF